MDTRGDPSLQRRRLRGELRKAREAAQLTQRQAAERLEWSLSKLIRIEAGSVGVSVTDLRAMLQTYDVTDDELVKSLTEAARGSKGQSWWSQYRDVVSPPFAQYLGHEGSAKSIRIFHPFLIPGLLQTQEYAVELLRVHLGARQTKRVVELRMKRQDSLLSQVGHPDVAFILGEESLYRWIGGPAVMRRQLQSLLEINTRPGITVQIVPFIAGAHPGLIGSFVLLGLAGSAEEILFLEGANGDMVSRADQERILKFGEHFEVARGLALPDDQAVALIHRQIRRLNQEDGNGRQ